MKKMFIHWDEKGDLIEIRFGKATPSYFEEIGDDVFERRDEETKEITGYAIFNIQKRKQSREISVDLPKAVFAEI